jgi:hypothetical protein
MIFNFKHVVSENGQMSTREKIALFQCIFQIFYINCLKNWKDRKESFALSWDRVLCSNFGYEDFWAFLDVIYKKLEISLSLLF